MRIRHAGRLPKRERRLAPVLSEKEIEKLIGAREPGGGDPAGWRDRALIETLYSCGVRDWSAARYWQFGQK